MAQNISVYVVGAICGNWWIESGINSGIWESLEVGTWTSLNKGFGLGQWTNTGGDTHGRLYRLNDYLVQTGHSDDSFYGQLDYIEVEDVWYSRQEASSFADLQSYLTTDSTDVELLTHAWNIGWEGIHDHSWDTRVSHAYDVVSYIQENYVVGETYVPVIGNFFATEAQRYNNALCMYDYWNGGTPSPDPPHRRTKGFKWWIYMPSF